MGLAKLNVSQSDIKRFARIVGQGSKSIELIKDFYIAVGSRIDDRIDEMPLAELLNCGDANIGDKPCDFILNPQIITEREWSLFNEMDRTGLLPMKDIINFGNILAVNVMEQAQIQQKIANSHDNSLRIELTKKHIQLTGICVAFMSQMLKPVEIPSDGLTTEYLQKKLPNTFRVGRAVELQDDIQDFVFDLIQEIETGKPVPNTLVTGLYTTSKNIIDDIDFLKKLAGKKFIHLSEVSDNLREVVKNAVTDYKDTINALPLFSKNFLYALINITNKNLLPITDKHKRENLAELAKTTAKTYSR